MQEYIPNEERTTSADFLLFPTPLDQRAFFTSPGLFMFAILAPPLTNFLDIESVFQLH